MSELAVPVSEEQLIVVRERLRWLTFAAYIRGGIIAAFSSFLLIYIIFMLGITLVPDSAWTNHPPSRPSAASSALPAASPAAISRPRDDNNAAPPKAILRIFAGIFTFIMLIGWTLGGLTAYAGWSIEKRRHKVLIYIMASFNCLFVPYGTLFGVATLLVLSSSAAKREFGSSSTAV